MLGDKLINDRLSNVDTSTMATEDKVLTLLNAYKSQNDIELSKLKPRIESLRTKIAHNKEQKMQKETQIKEVEAKLQIMKSTHKAGSRSDQNPEHAKLDNRRTDLMQDIRKIEVEIAEDDNAENESMKEEKMVK